MRVDRPYFVGIDTSCYTTSVGIVDGKGRIMADLRRMLTVRPGERGLRQGEALFQHVQNLPEILEEASGYTPFTALAYAATPRPQPGSYLPVFTAGSAFARAIAASNGFPAYAVTHQEGHIRAALAGYGKIEKKILGVHLSGGTSEILEITWNSGRFALNLLGGTTDLHAGQMVDRVGVMMGLPFPAGPHIEKLAKKAKKRYKLPVSVSGLSVSFSGPTSAALRALEQGIKAEDLAFAVQECLAVSISALIKGAQKHGDYGEVLLFGGVAANTYLRERIREEIPRLAVIYGRPELSGDNGVGLALIARDLWEEDNIK